MAAHTASAPSRIEELGVLLPLQTVNSETNRLGNGAICRIGCFVGRNAVTDERDL